MNANRQVKVNTVSEISQKLKDSKAMVIAKYAGLSVKEITELRNQLREANVELKVYKNRIFKIAVKDSEYPELESSLTGPNVFAFGMEDDISPAKILAKFAKDHPALELLAGTFEGKVIDQAQVMEVATLPTLEEALTKLALALITPVKDLAIGLNMLEESHLSAAPAEEVKEEPKEETSEEPKEESAPAEEPKEEAAPAEEPKEEETPNEENKEEPKEEEAAPAEEPKEEETPKEENKEGEE